VNYDLLYGFIGIIVSLLFFVGSLLLCARGIRRASLHVRQLKLDVERLDMRYAQLEKQFELAKNTVEARRARLEQIAKDLTTMREETTSLINRAEAPIYVLQDRWTPADSEFLVTVRNASVVGRPIQKLSIRTWTEGRTYVVWAPNAEIASRLIEQRFPPSSSYEMGAIIASPLALAKRWDVAS
jgi:cell division protein FtsL